MAHTPLTSEHRNALIACVDAQGVITGDDQAPYLTEWRGRWQGDTPLLLSPANTQQLADVMAYAHAHHLAVVPQGGNTGLVGGQVPAGEILITLKRLRQIRDVSPQDFAMTLEAGVTLAEAQEVAAKHDRLFPLSIGSEGSCQVGGILSTNAGGVHVIRYGNARDLCLGLEVVLPDGRVWDGLNALRKNNTGYDLKHLFIGGEGTLGFITAAVLKLHPRPSETLMSFLAVPNAESAVELLSFVQGKSGGQIAAFELMSAATVDLVLKQFPELRRPVEADAPFFALVELTSGRPGELSDMAQTLLEDALEAGLISDGTVAQSGTQSDELWRIRHNASEAMKRDGMFCVKCDVSVPIRQVPSFLAEADRVVEDAAPGARVIAFGHMGDGNIHYDILGPEDGDDQAWRARAGEMERLVHDVVIAHEGSISAEHGIGKLKRDELAERKSDVEMDLMRRIKASLDPHGIMNPGKLL